MAWLRKHKKYSKPKKMHDQARVVEENKLKERYGLKNKREIWKADSEITRIRRLAKEHITVSHEEQQKFLEKLKKMGFKVSKIADVLALNIEDWLKRRLQSILVEKHIVSKIKAARQLITHKHVTINDKTVNVPGYIVPVIEEDKIKVMVKFKEKSPSSSKLENNLEAEEEIGSDEGEQNE